MTNEVERWTGCYGGTRGDLFLPASNVHPAKLAVGLCYKILQHGLERGYWKIGDCLLDPMSGICTVGICAATLGIRSVNVELEAHFVALGEANIDLLMAKMPNAPRPVLIQGDARRLREILEGADGAVTSPPYTSEFREQHPGTKGGKAGLEAQRGGSFRGYSGAVTSLPYAGNIGGESGIDAEKEKKVSGENAQHKIPQRYDATVASPPYGDQDLTGSGQFRSRFEPERPGAADNPREGYAGVVSSPPYGDACLPVFCRAEIRNLAHEGKWDGAITLAREVEKSQVARGQKFGVRTDAVIRKMIEDALAADEANYSGAITSPPYSETHVGNPGEQELAAKGQGRFIGTSATGHGGKGRHGFQYSHDEKAQIGNLRDPRGDIDAVLSSPPWQKQARGGQQGWTDPEKASLVAARRYQTGERKGHKARAEAIAAQMRRDNEKVYGSAQGQIGNKNAETYLSAMLAVYSELHAVLKPGGVVALVLKDPVKSKKIRGLGYDTALLMEKAGFQLMEIVKAMLVEQLGSQLHLGGGEKSIRRERKSFFKRLYEKKNPEMAVDFEWVLFFEKASDTGFSHARLSYDSLRRD